MNSLVAFIVRLLSGLRARWLGAAPLDSQRIYFANHTSTLDAAVLWAILPEAIRAKTRPIAAKDYWTANAIRRWLANDVFRALLIERRKVTIENNPLREMLAVLDAGESLIIFPEGGRFPGPEPQKFKGGLFHLAKDRPQVQLVPIYLENLNRILPKGEILPVPLLGSVTVGTPIRLEAGETKADFLNRARMAVWSLHST
ncbi:MAG TPA: lysophospholipid acyltransferase family protein [Terrimicrobiaceae bacterium]